MIFDLFKKEFPTYSDNEINQGVAALTQKFPEAPPEELVTKAKEMEVEDTTAKQSALESIAVKPETGLTGIESKYSADSRKQAMDAAEKEKKGLKWREALGVFGQGFTKNPNIGAITEIFDRKRAAIDDKYLGEFDKGKKESIESLKRGREEETYLTQKEKAKNDNDPESQDSLAYQNAIAGFTGKSPEDYAGMSKAQLKEMFPILSKQVDKEMDLKKSEIALADRKEAREMATADRREARDQRSFEKEQASKGKKDEKTEADIRSYRGELNSGLYAKTKQANLTASKVAANLDEFRKNPSGYSDYGTLMGGLKALQGDESVVREAEIRLGQNATSILSKVYNNMQSAATGKSLTDNQRKQISDTLGILADVAKKQYRDITKPVYNQVKKQGLPLKEIFDEDPEELEAYYAGAETPKLSKEDEQALDWAESNPNDPRSKQIMERLGM